MACCVVADDGTCLHGRVGHADKQAVAWAIREKRVRLEQLLTKRHARELVKGTCWSWTICEGDDTHEKGTNLQVGIQREEEKKAVVLGHTRVNLLIALG